MPCVTIKRGSVLAPVAIVSAAFVLGITGLTLPASAGTIREVTLASASQALTYCQSGKMKSNYVAYIAGAPGLVQYGPDQNCAQQVPTKGKVTKTIQVVGSKVSECTLAKAKSALKFCEGGSMGEWDIDYISGKVGETLSGPGYGCVVNYTTSSVGNAVCR